MWDRLICSIYGNDIIYFVINFDANYAFAKEVIWALGDIQVGA